MPLYRPLYRESHVLRAVDLAGEQAYRIAMQRRHNIGGHGWGIVNGLGIDEAGGEVVVNPGLAVDGYGRQLVLSEAVSLGTAQLQSLETDKADVWLQYGLMAATPRQRGRYACGPMRESRGYEEARVLIAEASSADPRLPMDVPDADLDFAAYREPPDDPRIEWPIYLGTVSIESGNLVVDKTRPYATLVGRNITTPRGDVVVRLGTSRHGDDTRAALSIQKGKDEWVDALRIDRRSQVYVAQDLHVEKNLELQGPASGAGPTSTRARLRFARPIDAPDKAAPWSIYRATVREKAGDKEVSHQQLRFEIADPGKKGDPTRYAMCLRHANGSKPILTAAADRSVTIHAELKVTGQIIQGPISADPNDTRLMSKFTDQWLSGLVAGGGKIGAAVARVLEVAVHVTTPVQVGASAEYTVTIKNSSKGTISNLEAYDNVLLGTTPLKRGQIGVKPSSLEKDKATDPLKVTFPIPAGTPAKEPLTVAVLAMAIGPEQTLVCGIGADTVTVEPSNPVS
ncbi:MAG: hypothetical protein HY270_18405 [Deltaproteobacteria bacterium]|nr:hypothetical protein [Deltaproteobacteria bacterium]